MVRPLLCALAFIATATSHFEPAANTIVKLVEVEPSPV